MARCEFTASKPPSTKVGGGFVVEVVSGRQSAVSQILEISLHFWLLADS
jgi:hypothetical protein